MRKLIIVAAVFGFSTPIADTTHNMPPVREMTIRMLIEKTVTVNKPLTKKPKRIVKIPNKELKCLKMNLYHEARGEGDKGIIEVMRVTKARVISKKFPNSICKVVWQRNQFEWTNDGKPDTIKNKHMWNHIDNLVKRHYNSLKVNRKVLYYHSGPLPRWFKKANLVKVKKVGNHLFYEEP